MYTEKRQRREASVKINGTLEYITPIEKSRQFGMGNAF
jgi:hypothetical protein